MVAARIQGPFTEPRPLGSRCSWVCASDFRDFLQCHGVHAIAQAARGGTIRKYVAQVRVTSVADSLDALENRRSIEPVGDYIRLDRLRKRRPAGVRLEFLRRIEENGFTTNAGIDSRLEEAAHFRAESSLRAGLPGYVVLFVAQLSPPFSVRLHHFAIRRRIAAFRQIENIGPLEHHYVFYVRGVGQALSPANRTVPASSTESVPWFSRSHLTLH
jgi:hypothetical protein